jgi:prepilin-type N-terminal cleavage/methylation domain-containing protein
MYYMQNRSFKKGFTLIELLIVISIIGILAVALLPSVLDAPASARDAARKTQVNSLLVAVEQYYATGGTLPGTAGAAQCWPVATTTGAYANINSLLKGGTLTVQSPAQSLGTIGTCPYLYYQMTDTEKAASGNGYIVCAALEKQAMGTNMYGITTLPTAAPGLASAKSNAYCVAK